MIKLRSRPAEPARTTMWRSRWAAVGAAIAVSLGAGGVLVSQAALGPNESTIVTVTPARILDSRDPTNLGLPGPFVSATSQKLQVTGTIPTATGNRTVVPAGATGVLLNVTAVQTSANGFISIRSGNATGVPTTSSLNVTAGVTVPNAVQIALPTSGANAGQIDITFDALGVAGPTTDMLIDVVGYTTNTGLQELGAGFFTQESGSIAWLADEKQEVATLDLPAGSYLVTAKLVANNNDSSWRTVRCSLELGANTIDDLRTGVIVGPFSGTDRESITLTSGGTLASAGTARILCSADSSDGNWLAWSITAMRLQSITGTAAPQAAPADGAQPSLASDD
jgi:hypothetical protein